MMVRYLPWQPAREQVFRLVAHLTDATMTGLVNLMVIPPFRRVD